MADYITSFLEGNIMGIPFWFLLVVGLFVFLIVLIAKKKKIDKYKKIEVSEEIRKKYKELFSIMGVKHIRKKLLWGMEVKGIIGRGIEKNFKDGTDNKANNITSAYAFEVYKDNIIGRFKRLLNYKPVYFFVDAEAITENPKEIIIDNHYSYDNYLSNIIISKATREIVSDGAYKINSEQQLNELVNWLPLQSYLSVQHAQNSEGLDHLAEIEKSKRQDTISEMTGKKVK